MSTSLQRPPVLLIALVALLLIGCRGALEVREPRTPFPTATSTVTPVPTATPPPFRMDCTAIESSQIFFGEAEQTWFIANCLVGPRVSRAYNERLGIGQREMEIFAVDQSVCESGLVSHTVLHEPDLELFTYMFRNFCAHFDPERLAFPPPLFACPDSDVITSIEVSLRYVPGFLRHETEVICSRSENTGESDSGAPSDGAQPEWS